MAETYDLIVVGGGVAGLCTAYYAALKGASVAVVERTGPGRDCASASAGWLVPSYCTPLTSPHNLKRGLASFINRDSAVRMSLRPDPRFGAWLGRFLVKSLQGSWVRQAEDILARLHRESFQLHGELARQAGDAYQYRTEGILFPYLAKAAWRGGRRDARHLARHGIETTALDCAQIRRQEPALGSRVVGGVHYPGDAWLEPQAFMAWLAREARSLGVKIHYHCEVFGFSRRGAGVSALDTTGGRLTAGQVVLAAGAWLPRLSGLLGRRLPLEAAKGYSVTYQPAGAVPRLPLDFEERGGVMAPYADRVRLIFGLEFRGLDMGFDGRRLARLPGLASTYLPATDWGQPVEIRQGLRPVSADGLPVVGRLAQGGNVFVAGGHDQKGLSLGPVSGYRLARLLAGEAPDELDRQLSPGRFFRTG